ncbi:hypothetical protein YC2023_041214 [Brassica napus]
MDFIRENSLCDSYCKAPMLTPIDTKRGIDLSRFGERHKVRSASSYSESGGVGRRVGRCVQSNSPNGRVGWCAQSNSPFRRVGLLVWFRVIQAAMPKSRKRPSTNPDAAKKRRYTKDSEADPLPAKASVSDLASQHRAKVYIDRKPSPLLSECTSTIS